MKQVQIALISTVYIALFFFNVLALYLPLQVSATTLNAPQTATIKPLREFELESRASHLKWSSDGDYLAVALWDKPDVLILDASTGNIKYTLPSGILNKLNFEFAIDNMDWCPMRNLLAIAYRTQPVLQIWQISKDITTLRLDIKYTKAD